MNIATDATLAHVVEGNYCSGCGACATVTGGRMLLNEYGCYLPTEVIDSVESQQVCPFLRPDLNEDVMSEQFLGSAPNQSDELGRFIEIYAAHVVQGDYRKEGSSGGVGTWLAARLLETGAIDGVIHVKPAARSGVSDPFFRYEISHSIEELVAGSHSHYHVVEVSEVMQKVIETPGRYLFIGVPCFVKAVRRLQLSNPLIRDRIVYCAALICGHMKSVNWSLSLGWGAGISPEDISEISFRVKQENIPAKAYYYAVKSFSKSEQRVLNAATVTGGKFNFGAMMLNACDYCDDVVGETADITIGDAWLPRFSYDWQGKNMLVVRNSAICELLNEANRSGLISLSSLTPSEAVFAQSGGFRHRREGLSYRLHRMRKVNQWAPTKRNFSTPFPSFHRRVVYYLRNQVARSSSEHFLNALKTGDWSLYERKMGPFFKVLRLVEIVCSLPRIILVRIRRIID